jgi:HSP20 family molecular chaperone IbpA
MSQVAIERVHGDESKSNSVFEEMKILAERVRDRAYQLFEGRSGENGSDLEDWFKAEREMIWAPESDLIEKKDKFELQISVPGFEPKDVSVTALRDAVVVRAESTHKHDKTEGDVRFCEFGERSLFRRFDLPAPINVDLVTANLDKGVLKLTATKAEARIGGKAAVA